MGTIYRKALEAKRLRQVNAVRVDRAVTRAELEHYARALEHNCPIAHLSLNWRESLLYGPRALEIVRLALKSQEL
jgi:hypothetical protein